MGNEGRGCEGSEAAKAKVEEDMLVYKVVKGSVLYEVVSTFHVNARL